MRRNAADFSIPGAIAFELREAGRLPSSAEKRRETMTSAKRVLCITDG